MEYRDHYQFNNELITSLILISSAGKKTVCTFLKTKKRRCDHGLSPVFVTRTMSRPEIQKQGQDQCQDHIAHKPRVPRQGMACFLLAGILKNMDKFKKEVLLR